MRQQHMQKFKKKKKKKGIWYNYSEEMDIVKIVKSLVEYGLKNCQ